MSIYSLDFDLMLHRLEELKKSYDIELSQLDNIAPGHLTGTHRNGRQNYLQTQIIDDKYCRHGIANEPDTLRHLCRKAYLKEALQIISGNIICLSNAKAQFSSLDYGEIIQSLPKVYQTLPSKYFFPHICKDPLADIAEKNAEISAKVKAWCVEPFKQSTYMPDKKIHTTSRGEKMRSKNEVLHAEIMYRLNIPFRYEPVLRIGQYTFEFDFAAIRASDEKVFYVEDCGMPHNREYMLRHKRKMEIYESAGIVPWDNLIVTYGDAKGNIDVRVIENELRSKLL